jgi:hypothetical protein
MMRGTRVRAFVLVSVVAGLAGVLVAPDKAVPTLIRAGALVDVVSGTVRSGQDIPFPTCSTREPTW